jgi:Tol biopolymer transport system component
MKSDRFDVLERLAPLLDAPEPSFEGFLRRRDRKRRNQRIAAGVVGIALFVVPIALIAFQTSRDGAKTPADRGRSIGQTPEIDYVIDLDTGEMTPLPEAIIQTAGTRDHPILATQYAVSPDGSMLAYVAGVGDEEQIFIAGIDGTGVRQMTHDPGIPGGAPGPTEPSGGFSPTWSPDGATIAYEGYGSEGVHGLFVLDVASGESTPIDGSEVTRILPMEPQFTPDGSSLVYTGGSDTRSEIRIVPIDGGESTVLIGAGGNLRDASNASLSPDGSQMTFLGTDAKISGPGPQRWVSNADGTERRLLPNVYGIPCGSNPAGTWSPDGSRIVCREASKVIVIDIATGRASPVAQGRGAIWLDDHTLLVSV